MRCQFSVCLSTVIEIKDANPRCWQQNRRKSLASEAYPLHRWWVGISMISGGTSTFCTLEVRLVWYRIPYKRLLVSLKGSESLIPPPHTHTHTVTHTHSLYLSIYLNPATTNCKSQCSTTTFYHSPSPLSYWFSSYAPRHVTQRMKNSSSHARFSSVQFSSVLYYCIWGHRPIYKTLFRIHIHVHR